MCKNQQLFLVDDYFCYTHDLDVWYRGAIVWGNYMLVTVRGQGGHKWGHYWHFFAFSSRKMDRFHLCSCRLQKMSKIGKNINDTLSCAWCTTLLFLLHFDVICDLLVCRETWNLFLVRSLLGYKGLNICKLSYK